MRTCLNVCMSWKMPSHIFSSTLLLKKKSELGMKEREEKKHVLFFHVCPWKTAATAGKNKNRRQIKINP